uniref:Anaphase-promoting complex subunit 5 n=1 Tax=Oncorhynchus tshawytscha TaxID=74940 RepID=A0AAZ3R058_ONCTS
MLLAYIKLPFKQVYKLYNALQHYYHSHYAQPGDGQVGLPALTADDSDMALTSTEDTVGERMEEELDTAPLHEILKVEGSTVSSAYPLHLPYAALNLAPLHCRFGHYQQADLALHEAIRIAQESNDHVCLQHCLVGYFMFVLYMKGPDSSALTEDSVKMDVHFCLLGAIQGKTAHELMDHSLSELIDISLAQTSSIWMMYGKSNVNHNSLCHLAELHGLYGAVSEVLKHLKEQFPPHTQHATVSCWLVVVAQHPVKTLYVGVSFILAVYLCMCCVNRKAQVPKALNRTTKAYSILQRLQLYCEKTKYSEMSIRWARTLNKNTRPHLSMEITLQFWIFTQPKRLIPCCLPPGLGLAMQTLVEAVAYFSMLDCKGRLWDIHYLQARLHHTLGQTPQCNKCAKLFHLLELQPSPCDSEQSSPP